MGDREARQAYGRRGISRREFLKLGGARLAGAALLGAASCDGGEGGAGAITFRPDDGGVVDAPEHVWTAGGDILNGDEVVVDSTESAEGLSLQRSMITDGVALRATGDYTTQESQAIFTNGEVVFMRNWPFVYGLLSDPELSNVRPEQVEISLLPVAEEGDTSFSWMGDGTSCRQCCFRGQAGPALNLYRVHVVARVPEDPRPGEHAPADSEEPLRG